MVKNFTFKVNDFYLICVIEFKYFENCEESFYRRYFSIFFSNDFFIIFRLKIFFVVIINLHCGLKWIFFDWLKKPKPLIIFVYRSNEFFIMFLGFLSCTRIDWTEQSKNSFSFLSIFFVSKTDFWLIWFHIKSDSFQPFRRT